MCIEGWGGKRKLRGRRRRRRRGREGGRVVERKKFPPTDLIVSSGLPLQCTAHSCRQPKDLHLMNSFPGGV